MSDAVENEYDEIYPGSIPEEVVEGEVVEDQSPEKQPEELMFDVDGQQVAYSKLTPESVKNWYEAHTNSKSWKRANTEEAQKIAKEREDWKTDHEGSEKSLEEYKIWNQYFNANPELREYVENYINKPQEQQQSASTSQYDQRLAEMDKRLRASEQRSASRDKADESVRIEKERNAAILALKEKDPDMDEEKFYTFLSEATDNMNDLSSLYSLVHDAWNGRNKNQIEKAAKQELVRNIKNKQASAVETGNATSAVDVPDNVNIGADYDDIFDDFKRQQGIT